METKDNPLSSSTEPKSLLDKFENKNRQRNYLINFTIAEFTCVCPKTGFPDFATIHIDYHPNQYCVELKSLKLYINAYRNLGIFHEEVANSIVDDLVALIKPLYMKVFADFNVRGNIHTTVTAIHGTKLDSYA